MNKMLFRLFICLMLSFLALSYNVQGQNKKRTVSKATNIKVVADKPGVYISFDRLGKRTPLREGESDEGVWLRLHNNMRYSINFCAFGVSAEGKELIMYGKDTQMGIYYDVLLNPVAITDERPQIDVPSGYPIGGTCHGFELKSGKSLVFSVPKEHLIKGLSIKIQFNYEWEEPGENNPNHFVYFNSLDIPK